MKIKLNTKSGFLVVWGAIVLGIWVAHIVAWVVLNNVSWDEAHRQTQMPPIQTGEPGHVAK